MKIFYVRTNKFQKLLLHDTLLTKVEKINQRSCTKTRTILIGFQNCRTGISITSSLMDQLYNKFLEQHHSKACYYTRFDTRHGRENWFRNKMLW